MANQRAIICPALFQLFFEKAQEMGVFTVEMTGKQGGKIAQFADLIINIPSDDTPRIQESHIMIGHIVCELVEKELFGNE